MAEALPQYETAFATTMGSGTAAKLCSDNIPRSIKIQQALKELDEHGVAVIPDVLTESECDEQVTLIHDWLARFHPNHPQHINSIIKKYNIGHCEVMWNCRVKVKPVFAEIYGTEKLLTSFDGMAVAPPPENGDAQFKFAQDGNDYNGLHLDQGPYRKGFHAYQGALYLEEADCEDYCFKVIRGSHQYHEEFFEIFDPNPRSEFKKLGKQQIEWYLKRGCEVKRVAVPKGGMVLWDSRTVHAGAPPVYKRTNPRWRYVNFICMAPAKWAEFKDFVEKQKGYENMVTSNHWPANGAKLNVKYRAIPGLDFTKMPKIACTEEAKKLAGVQYYDISPEDNPQWMPQYDERFEHFKLF